MGIASIGPVLSKIARPRMALGEGAWSEKATAFGGATPLGATFGEILWPEEILTAPFLPKTTSECEAS